MQRKVITVFFIWFGAMFILGCLISTSKQAFSIEDFDFVVSDSDELYFKNVRSFYYDKEEDDQSGYTMYRLKKWRSNPTSTGFSPYIIHNWRMNSAYIGFENNRDYHALQIHYPDSLVEVQIQYPSSEDYLEIAGRIFTAEKPGTTFILSNNTRLDTLESNEMERKEIFTVIKDYFDLCGKTR